MFILSGKHEFPPLEFASEDGLLAIGGDLSVERLLVAYRNGIFPWYNYPQPIAWYSPDPRFVMFPNDLKVSNSMKTLLRKGNFEFKINTDFSTVINMCKNITRPQQDGTWLNNEMAEAYKNLHRLGYCHSAETWLDGKLVGGLYGIKLGRIFFGESMFSSVSNASKFAFINFIEHLKKDGLALVDCQIETPHLKSLGAKFISRNKFLELLNVYC